MSALLVFACDAVGQDRDSFRYWKGNLHTHSLWSDGTDFPEMIAKWYVDRDYDFLALSDHNILSRGEKWMDLEVVNKRGGESCMEKYRAEFGDAIEIRETEIKIDKPIETENNDSESEANSEADSQPKIKTEVRLKTLDETRSLYQKPGEFILIECEEISDSYNRLPIHMNATNLKDKLLPVGGDSVREAIRNNMRAANEQAEKYDREILVHLNHPNFGWAIKPEDLAAVTEEQFFEIFNGHPGVRQLGDENHPSLEHFWDIVNTLRIDRLDSEPVFGLGVDDCHEYHGRAGSRPGRAWVMVRSKTLDPESLISAMKMGDFYSSSGVTLESIRFDHDNRELTVEIKGEEGVEYSTQFMGTLKNYTLWESPEDAEIETGEESDSDSETKSNEDSDKTTARQYSNEIGQILKTETGLIAKFKLTGNELYVRALVTSNKKHPDPSIENQFEQAWTQPFGWR